MPPAAAQAEPAVTFEKGADVNQALAAIHRATAGAVLCERPQVPRELEAAYSGPLSGAIQHISGSFGLFWIRRGSSLTFQTRFADPRETLDLELEELAAIAGDVNRLIQPFPRYPEDGISQITSQRNFWRSFSSEQIAVMRAGIARQGKGLPLTALSPEQQALWMRINSTEGFSGDALAASAAAEVFRTWRQGSLAWVPGTDGRPILWHRYPDPRNGAGQTS